MAHQVLHGRMHPRSSFFAKASRGEERTFALLKKLPDDYWIYYEPNIDNRHPDFIVIAPDLSVIIIEVKVLSEGTVQR